MTDLKRVINFTMSSITLIEVVRYLDEVGNSKLKTTILHILKDIEVGRERI